jgi:hypothetical protein
MKMKPGDLRRFGNFKATGADHLIGCVFMVLSVTGPCGTAQWVDILVDGKIDPEWSYPWVEQNSEPL